MKRIILVLTSALMLTALTHAQDAVVPASYELKSKEDYSNYEKNMIAAAKWLVSTPLGDQAGKRKEVSAFVIQWVSGSPTVNVEINPSIMEFEEKNAGMLVIYMAASAQYVLENNYSKDMRAKQKAALQALTEVYKNSKDKKKDKKMEKLVKAQEEGTMDKWLEDNLKIEGH